MSVDCGAGTDEAGGLLEDGVRLISMGAGSALFGGRKWVGSLDAFDAGVGEVGGWTDKVKSAEGSCESTSMVANGLVG